MKVLTNCSLLYNFDTLNNDFIQKFTMTYARRPNFAIIISLICGFYWKITFITQRILS